MEQPTNSSVKISRIAKGKRPSFYPEEPAAERLLSIVSALITEVAVLRERVDTMERIADKKGLVLIDEIEAFDADATTLKEREVWRNAYMDRVLQILDIESAIDS